MLDVIYVSIRVDNFFKQKSHKRNVTMILQEVVKLSLSITKPPQEFLEENLRKPKTKNL